MCGTLTESHAQMGNFPIYDSLEQRTSVSMLLDQFNPSFRRLKTRLRNSSSGKTAPYYKINATLSLSSLYTHRPSLFRSPLPVFVLSAEDGS